MHLFLQGEQVGLHPCVAFPGRADLFGEHAQSSLLVIALLSNAGESLPSLIEVGLQLRFLQGQIGDGGVKGCTGGGFAKGFGQFSRSFADLMLKLVDPAHQSFCASIGLFCHGTGLGQIDLHAVEGSVGFFQGDGMFFPGLRGFSCDDVGCVTLFVKLGNFSLQLGLFPCEGILPLL